MARTRKPKSPLPAQAQGKPGLDSKMKPRPKFEAAQYRGAGKLRNQVALITGGDSGIGRSVAVHLAREGTDVAIVYPKAEQSDAEETQRAVTKDGREALLLPDNVTNRKFCDGAVKKSVETFNRLDILVNNAAHQETRKGLENPSGRARSHFHDRRAGLLRVQLLDYVPLGQLGHFHAALRGVVVKDHRAETDGGADGERKERPCMTTNFFNCEPPDEVRNSG